MDSYDDIEDLKKDHPTGNPGDAYLVKGVLYVWDVEKNEWKGTGDLTGPQGPQGTGTTIKGSYKTLEEFEQNPPPGSLDDAYLVDGEIYIWNETDGWHSGGSLKGEKGTGTTIKGSYKTLDEFEQNPPPGSLDDAYLVAGEIYIWNETDGWHSGGSLKGEKGDKGEPGTQLNQGDPLFDISDSDGKKSTMGYKEELSFESNTLDISVETGPKIKIENPQPNSYTIIPFASTDAPFTYSNNGNPSRVSLIGFGYGDRRQDIPTLLNYSIQIDPVTLSFDLNKVNGNQNKQLVFSLPFNMLLKSIYITVGTYDDFNFANSIYPYVQLFSADPGSNVFNPIPDAYAIPTLAIGPGNTTADTMRSAYKEDIDYLLKAGTRIAIGAMLRTHGTSSENYWLYFTGGIGLAYVPAPTP